MSFLQEIERGAEGVAEKIDSQLQGTKKAQSNTAGIAEVSDMVTDLLVTSLAQHTGIAPTGVGVSGLFTNIIAGSNLSPLAKALLDIYQTSQVAGTDAGLQTAVGHIVTLAALAPPPPTLAATAASQGGAVSDNRATTEGEAVPKQEQTLQESENSVA